MRASTRPRRRSAGSAATGSRARCATATGWSGWGCATRCYPTQIGAAAARVRLMPSGDGARPDRRPRRSAPAPTPSSARSAAERLGVPLERVTVELGDSRSAARPVAGGSNTTASVCNGGGEGLRGHPRTALSAVATGREGPSQVPRTGRARPSEHEAAATPGALGARSGIVEAARQRRHRGLCREHPARAPTNAMAGLYKGAAHMAGGAKPRGPRPVRLRRPVRRGAGPRPHARDPRPAHRSVPSPPAAS